MARQNIEWQAYERTPRTHRADWYWAMGIIACSLTVTAIILHNALFAALIVISAAALFLRTLQIPRLVRYELSSKGVWQDKEFVSYTALESFWIEEEYGEPKLIVKAKHLLSPYLILPLGDTDPETVRGFLGERLPEVEHHEPLSRKIMEFLGF